MSVASISSAFSRDSYQDPILSAFSTREGEISTAEILDITQSLPQQHARITSQCHRALKLYKKLLGVQYQLNSWEFLTLKTSIDLNFSSDGSTTRKFDIKIATNCIDKCGKLDDELDVIDDHMTSLKTFISALSIDEYISDAGSLILKIYFKLLNLTNSLNENLSISYTKSKLLIILYELTQILIKLNDDVNPLVRDNTDYQSTLNSYKNFVKDIISQLDSAIEQKDSEQIQECLNILNDVEKMYESVRINFEFLNDDLYDDYDDYPETKALQYEDDLLYSKSSTSTRPRRDSISSTTSSLARHSMMGKTTLTEELPYLLHAFDEAKQLEQELSEYQQQSTTQTSPHIPSPLSSSSYTSSSAYGSPPQSSSSTSSISSAIFSKAKFPSQQPTNQDKRPPSANLTSGYTSSNLGFSSTLLNNIYGLHPGSGTSPAKPHKNILSAHNEVD